MMCCSWEETCPTLEQTHPTGSLQWIPTLTSLQMTLIKFLFYMQTCFWSWSDARKTGSLLTRWNRWVTWPARRAPSLPLLQPLWFVWLLPFSASVTDLILRSALTNAHPVHRWRGVCSVSAAIVSLPVVHFSQGIIMNEQVSVYHDVENSSYAPNVIDLCCG